MSSKPPQTPAALPSPVVHREILPNAVYVTNECAELLRCRPSTIRAYVRKGIISGKGKPFRVLGRELFKLV